MGIKLETSSVSNAAVTRAYAWRDIACLAVAMLVVRLTVYFLTLNEYGDPDARALWGSYIYDAPQWIKSGFWLPLHPYAIALLMVPFKDPLFAGRMLSVVAGIATIVPFFFLSTLYFGRKVAVVAGIMLSLYGLHVGLSVIVMTETCFVLLGLWGLLVVCREIESEKPRFGMICLSAALLSIAGGFRHEAWQLTGILALWLIIDRRTRVYAVVFGTIGFSFFALWTIGNVLAGNGVLYSLTGVASQKAKELALVQHTAVGNIVKWIWIIVESPGPLISLLGLQGLWLAFRKRLFPTQLAWISLLMVAPYVVLSILKTEWRPQQRYVVFMVVLLLPYAAAALIHLVERTRHAKKYVVFVLVASLLGQAAAYSRTSDLFLPVRDYEQTDVDVWTWMAAHLGPDDRIVVEDLGWRSPGIILHSGRWRRPYRSVFSIDPPERMSKAIEETNATVVVLSSTSQGWPFLRSPYVDEIYRNADYRVVRLRGSP